MWCTHLKKQRLYEQLKFKSSSEQNNGKQRLAEYSLAKRDRGKESLLVKVPPINERRNTEKLCALSLSKDDDDDDDVMMTYFFYGSRSYLLSSSNTKNDHIKH